MQAQSERPRKRKEGSSGGQDQNATPASEGGPTKKARQAKGNQLEVASTKEALAYSEEHLGSMTAAQQTSSEMDIGKLRWWLMMQSLRVALPEPPVTLDPNEKTLFSEREPASKLTLDDATLDRLLLMLQAHPDFKGKSQDSIKQKLEKDYGYKMSKDQLQNRLKRLNLDVMLSKSSKTLTPEERTLWDTFSGKVTAKQVAKIFNNKFKTDYDDATIRDMYSVLRKEVEGDSTSRMKSLADNKEWLENAVLTPEMGLNEEEELIFTMIKEGHAAPQIKERLSARRSSDVTANQYAVLRKKVVKKVKAHAKAEQKDPLADNLLNTTHHDARELVSQQQQEPIPSGSGTAMNPRESQDFAFTALKEPTYINFLARTLHNLVRGTRQSLRHTRYLNVITVVIDGQEYYKTSFVNRSSDDTEDNINLPFNQDVDISLPMNVEILLPRLQFDLKELRKMLDGFKTLFDCWQGEDLTPFMIAGLQNGLTKTIFPEKALNHNAIVFKNDKYEVQMRIGVPFTGEEDYRDDDTDLIPRQTATVTADPDDFNPKLKAIKARVAFFGGHSGERITPESLGASTTDMSEEQISQHIIALEALKDFVATRDYMLITANDIRRLWEQCQQELDNPEQMIARKTITADQDQPGSLEDRTESRYPRLNNPARSLYGYHRLFGLSQNQVRTCVKLVPSNAVESNVQGGCLPSIMLKSTRKSLLVRLVEKLEVTWISSGSILTAWRETLQLAEVINTDLATNDPLPPRVCECVGREDSKEIHCCDFCLTTVQCCTMKYHYSGDLLCSACYKKLPSEAEDIMIQAKFGLNHVLSSEFRKKGKNPQGYEAKSIYAEGCKTLIQYQDPTLDDKLRCMYSGITFRNVGTGTILQRKPMKISIDAIFPYGEKAIHSADNIGPCFLFLNYMKSIWVPAVLQHMADFKRGEISKTVLQERMRDLHFVTLLSPFRINRREQGGIRNQEERKAMWLTARIANVTPELERLRYENFDRNVAAPDHWQFPYDADIERILGQMEEAYLAKYGIVKKFRRGRLDGCVVFFDGEIPEYWSKWTCWEWLSTRKERMSNYCNKYWETIDSQITLLLQACLTWLNRELDLGDTLFPDAPWELWRFSPLRISFGKRKPNVAMRTGFINDQPKDLNEFNPALSNISVETWIANLAKNNFDTASHNEIAGVIEGLHLDARYYDPDLAAPTVTMPEIIGEPDELYEMEYGEDGLDEDIDAIVLDPPEEIASRPLAEEYSMSGADISDAPGPSAYAAPGPSTYAAPGPSTSASIETSRAVPSVYTTDFKELLGKFTPAQKKEMLMRLSEEKVDELLLEMMEREPESAFKMSEDLNNNSS